MISYRGSFVFLKDCSFVNTIFKPIFVQIDEVWK